jgi:P4 family phage/plasmid primase-like protien
MTSSFLLSKELENIPAVKDSYHYVDNNILKDPEYVDARDNRFKDYVLEIYRNDSTGAIRIKHFDVSVSFHPSDPELTYRELLNEVLALDKEFVDNPELWKFTQRDLRYQLKRIYKCKDKKEEAAKAEQQRQLEERKKETKRETKVRELAEKLEEKYHFAAMQDTKELFYYVKKKGVYEPAGPLVEAELEKLQLGILTDTVNNVIQKLARRHLHKRDDFDSDKYIINMQNGLYDIRAGKLKKHTHRYLSRSQIPVKYVPKAKCVRFGKFLHEVVYPDQVRTMVETMAYTLLRDNPFEHYVILLGVGSNGKSVLMHVLTALHGTDNVSSTPLTSLLTNRFAKKELEGKNINIDMEMSKATINDMSVLKELTGVQPVRIEPKHLPAYTTRLWAKLFFSTNEMPEMNDYSDGHFRREIIISCPYRFEEVSTEQEKADIELSISAGSNRRIADPALKDKLTTPEELSGIFNALVTPLRKIMLERKPVYTDAKSIEDRRKRHVLVADPIGAFWEDAITPDPDGSVYKDTLSNSYKLFCKVNRLPIDGYDSFCRAVKRKFQYEGLSDGRDNSKERKALWKGIKLIKWETTDPAQDVLTV